MRYLVEIRNRHGLTIVCEVREKSEDAKRSLLTLFDIVGLPNDDKQDELRDIDTALTEIKEPGSAPVVWTNEEQTKVVLQAVRD